MTWKEMGGQFQSEKQKTARIMMVWMAEEMGQFRPVAEQRKL